METDLWIENRLMVDRGRGVGGLGERMGGSRTKYKLGVTKSRVYASELLFG